LPLAGHNVQRIVQPGEMLLSGGDNDVAHDAQRLAVRRAAAVPRNGTALPARPHQLKSGSLMAPMCRC
jgi:hypothetical protein